MQNSLWSSLLQARHYYAIASSLGTYSNPIDGLRRYLLNSGEYPVKIGIRTPIGEIRPTLFHPDDMLTTNLVFCRRDYAALSDVRCVVDLGSNIGLSVLYFLSRNRYCRVWAYEPVPQNIQRFRLNVADFANRIMFEEVAVSNVSGVVEFGTEPTGIYGGIGQMTGNIISVPCRHINDVLTDVLAQNSVIDILKIDIEGCEIPAFEAISPELLARIRVVYLEGYPPPHYGFSQRGNVARLDTKTVHK